MRDVVGEYAACTGVAPPGEPAGFVATPGQAVASGRLNIRKGHPSRLAGVAKVVSPGTVLTFDGWVVDGEPVNGNPKWFRDADGNFFWSGAVR